MSEAEMRVTDCEATQLDVLLNTLPGIVANCYEIGQKLESVNNKLSPIPAPDPKPEKGLEPAGSLERIKMAFDDLARGHEIIFSQLNRLNELI